MAKQVLLIQGAGEGAHEADAKLAASLRSKLGKTYEVRFPAMANEADPDYETWKRIILREIDEMGEGAILVGHSIGASLPIKTLVEERPRQSIAGVLAECLTQ